MYIHSGVYGDTQTFFAHLDDEGQSFVISAPVMQVDEDKLLTCKRAGGQTPLLKCRYTGITRAQKKAFQSVLANSMAAFLQEQNTALCPAPTPVPFSGSLSQDASTTHYAIPANVMPAHLGLLACVLTHQEGSCHPLMPCTTPPVDPQKELTHTVYPWKGALHLSTNLLKMPLTCTLTPLADTSKTALECTVKPQPGLASMLLGFVPEDWKSIPLVAQKDARGTVTYRLNESQLPHPDIAFLCGRSSVDQEAACFQKDAGAHPKQWEYRLLPDLFQKLYMCRPHRQDPTRMEGKVLEWDLTTLIQKGVVDPASRLSFPLRLIDGQPFFIAPNIAVPPAGMVCSLHPQNVQKLNCYLQKGAWPGIPYAHVETPSAFMESGKGFQRLSSYPYSDLSQQKTKLGILETRYAQTYIQDGMLSFQMPFDGNAAKVYFCHRDPRMDNGATAQTCAARSLSHPTSERCSATALPWVTCFQADRVNPNDQIHSWEIKQPDETRFKYFFNEKNVPGKKRPIQYHGFRYSESFRPIEEKINPDNIFHLYPKAETQPPQYELIQDLHITDRPLICEKKKGVSYLTCHEDRQEPDSFIQNVVLIQKDKAPFSPSFSTYCAGVALICGAGFLMKRLWPQARTALRNLIAKSLQIANRMGLIEDQDVPPITKTAKTQRKKIS